ncbi:MAG: hypothetical protein H0X62_03865 [Bacteroidetes bacterium]|nr:hypothetical protein [Bacteroidota bacterium]
MIDLIRNGLEDASFRLILNAENNLPNYLRYNGVSGNNKVVVLRNNINVALSYEDFVSTLFFDTYLRPDNLWGNQRSLGPIRPDLIKFLDLPLENHHEATYHYNGQPIKSLFQWGHDFITVSTRYPSLNSHLNKNIMDIAKCMKFALNRNLNLHGIHEIYTIQIMSEIAIHFDHTRPRYGANLINQSSVRQEKLNSIIENYELLGTYLPNMKFNYLNNISIENNGSNPYKTNLHFVLCGPFKFEDSEILSRFLTENENIFAHNEIGGAKAVFDSMTIALRNV